MTTTLTALPADLLTQGTYLPVPGEDRPAFVAPTTVEGLLLGDYAHGTLSLPPRTVHAMLAAAWITKTHAGYAASEAFTEAAANLRTRDRLTEVTDCTEQGHAPEPHQHIVFNDLCPHGTPKRYACCACEFGNGTT